MYSPAAFTVETDEWRNVVIAAVFIISHGVMGGIRKKFVYIRLRQELLHGVPVIEKPEGIMPGSGTEEGEAGRERAASG